MPNTYVALRTETVAVATNSVTFSLSGISGYTDLVLVINNTHSTNAVDGWFRLNGDTGSNYSRTNLNGDGTSATSGRNSNVAFGYGILVLTTPSTNILQFMNYANTTTNKTVLMRSNNAGSGGYVQATVDLWRSTAAITSIEIGCVSGNFAVGSTFSLYGIANADQGSAKATGGIITEDSQYWYHTFGASGAFIPKQSLTCDVLVVAGGGGGGNMYAGGGGAGGVAYQTGRSVPVATYNVTVGAGATAVGSGSSSVGNSGSNSVFDTITALGGGGGGTFNAIVGVNGGSGGGGPMGATSGTTAAGGSATQGTSGGATGYGNAGGAGLRNGAIFIGGGGGGSGAAGAAASGSIAGVGGVGLTTWSSWGSVTGIGENVSGTYYLAGGGGGGAEGATASSGGLGGGGRGGQYTVYSPGNGLTNTGGGGGAVGGNLNTGASGGSGVVIVRYLKA